MPKYILKEPIEAVLIRTKEDFPDGVYPYVVNDKWFYDNSGEDALMRDFGSTYAVKYPRSGWEFVPAYNFDAMFRSL